MAERVELAQVISQLRQELSEQVGDRLHVNHP